MLKRVCSLAYMNRDEKTKLCLKAINRQIHSGQPHCSARSFFGVEDFLDDDNSRPYTYQKEKKSKNPNKHISFKQRTIAYMEPFTLDVFISKRFVSASLTHRVTSKQVAVAGTNSKDIKAALKSRSDIPACMAIGRILSERAREADVYTASYTPRERDKFEGSYLDIIKRTARFICPADIIPPFIEVDLSELDAGQKLVMGDLKVHPALKLARARDEPVCKVAGARVSEQKKSK